VPRRGNLGTRPADGGGALWSIGNAAAADDLGQRCASQEPGGLSPAPVAISTRGRCHGVTGRTTCIDGRARTMPLSPVAVLGIMGSPDGGIGMMTPAIDASSPALVTIVDAAHEREGQHGGTPTTLWSKTVARGQVQLAANPATASCGTT